MGAAGHREERGRWLEEERRLEATRAPPGCRVLGNFKQMEPPPAAETPFSGLFAMAKCHLGPTPQGGGGVKRGGRGGSPA